MTKSIDVPPVWFAGSCVAVWLLATELPLVMAFGPVFRLAGIGIVLAGMALIAWSAVWFRRKGTTIEPHHTPRVLITEGPYRFSRNPIYLGLVAMLTGLVLFLGALSPVPVPGLFVSVLTLRFIEPEEARLRQIFGAEAHRYIGATRRWL